MRRKNVVCGSYPRQLPAPEPILIRFEDLFPHGIAAAILGPRLEDCPKAERILDGGCALYRFTRPIVPARN